MIWKPCSRIPSSTPLANAIFSSRWKTLLLALLLGALVGCSKPDFHDQFGDGQSLAKLHEKYLVVNYWATWCAPCIKEIPELNELAASQADVLTVLGVNFDQPEGDEFMRQIDRMKITFPVANQEIAGLLGVEIPQVLPTTFVFAPGGELVATLVGPQTEETLLAAIGSEHQP